jgi:hypothetical protein
VPLDDPQEYRTKQQEPGNATQLTLQTDTRSLFSTTVRRSDLDDTVAPHERDAERTGLAFTVDIVGLT